jgi:hypothetical protein
MFEFIQEFIVLLLIAGLACLDFYFSGDWHR